MINKSGSILMLAVLLASCSLSALDKEGFVSSLQRARPSTYWE